MARPTSYRPEYDEQAEKLCRLGATENDLADFFGIAVQTLYNWREQFPSFVESLKNGKEKADAEVADRLYKRALGYSHQAVKIFCDPKSGAQEIVEYTEHYPPDTTACIFWLKNRRPDVWRDKTEVTIRKVAEELDDNELTRIASGGSEGTPAKKSSKEKPAQVH